VVQLKHALDRGINFFDTANRTDYIELYQTHRHDPKTPLEETLG